MLRDTAARYKPECEVEWQAKKTAPSVRVWSPVDGAVYLRDCFALGNDCVVDPFHHETISLGITVQRFCFALVHVKDG